MLYYSFDRFSNEYTGSEEAYLNPEATKKQGEDVYWLPAYATFIEPPILSKNEVAVFDTQNNKWVIRADYRGTYICDEALQVRVVNEIGAIPEGFIIITETQAEEIFADPLKYIVKNGELILNPNYEEQKEQQRREYLSKLAMTKYDFYKFVCKPNNITYTMLMQMVTTNEEIAAAWNLCGHVFRGDETLCTYITQFLPIMTSEVLDEIFEQHGKVINE